MASLFDDTRSVVTDLKAIPGRQAYFLDVPGTDSSAEVSVVSYTAKEKMGAANELTIMFTHPRRLGRAGFLNQEATFSIAADDGSVKRYSGHISRFSAVKTTNDFTRHEIILKSGLGRLEGVITTAIYQHKSTPQIIETILRRHGMKGHQFVFRLRDQYPLHLFRMQYRMSDMEYIHMLMERDGIYCFVVQTEHGDQTVFADDVDHYLYDPRLAVPYREAAGLESGGVEAVTMLKTHAEVVPQSYVVADYNPEKAWERFRDSANVAPQDQTTYGQPYIYGTHHLDQAGAKRQAQIRHESAIAWQVIYEGGSTVLELQPGRVLEMDTDLPDAPDGLVVIEVTHSGARDKSYSNSFKAIPANRRFRLQFEESKWARISGTLSARVTSPDRYKYGYLTAVGYYTVRFDVDFADWPKGGESVPLRLAKPFAGNYESLYDERKRAALVTQLDTKLKPWFDDVEKRFVDLKAWLTSQAVTNAFESYDPNRVECGLLFEYQSSLCTYALATSKGGEALLREWTKDVNVAQTNLLNRQMLLNQKAAIDDFKKAAGKLKGMPDVDSGTLQQMVSSVTGMIDKANAIVSGLGKGGVVPEGMGGVAAKFLSGALFFSTIGQTAFAPTAGAVNKLYAFVIYVRGGAKAYLQGAADAMIGIFDSAYVSKAGDSIDEAKGLRAKLTEAAKANTDDHASMRFGTALALIESWNLGLKYAAARGKDRWARESWDLYAAVASTSAAIAVSVANLTKVVKLSTAWIEHLSLSSGVLGGFAAGVTAVESGVDAGHAFGSGRYLAFTMLASKSALNAVAAAGSLYVGTLYSAPFLKRIGESLGERWMGESLTRAGEWISKQALKETMLFGAELVVREAAEVIAGFIGWALIVEQIGELAILAVSDNKMQVWLTRCRFRKPQAAYGGFWGTIVHDKDAGNPYETLEKEGTEFDAALKAGV